MTLLGLRHCLACLLFYAWLLPSCPMLVENPAITPVIFRIGVFQFFHGNERNGTQEDRFILELLRQCSALESQQTTFDYHAVFLLFKGVQGWRLSEATGSVYHHHHRSGEGRSSLTADAAFTLSHRINICPGRVTTSNEGNEVFLHVAMAVWPWNTFVHKNLLFYYEWHGFNGAMQALYTDALAITGDESLLLQQIFSVPPVLYSLQQGEDIHLRMLKKAYAFLTHAEVTTRNPYQDIRELQQNIEYIGYSNGIVMEMYILCVYHRYSPFFQLVPSVSGPAIANTTTTTTVTTFRIGIVSEHANNGAPDLCIVDILKLLPLACEQETVSSSASAPPCTALNLVFFDRPKLNNDFAKVARQRAQEVIILNEYDVVASATAIRDAHVDVLMYIALPTEKFTVLLSQFRLAKTQIVFGSGQPITSGSKFIDYNVFSRSFVYDLSVLTRRASPADIRNMVKSTRNTDALSPKQSLPGDIESSLAYQCALVATGYESFKAFGDKYPVCGSVGGLGNIIYTEQTILLNSLGYFLQDSSLLYQEYSDVQLQKYIPPPLPSVNNRGVVTSSSVNGEEGHTSGAALSFLSCAEVDNMLALWGLAPNISTATFSIPCTHPFTSHTKKGPEDRFQETTIQKKRLYLCIQLNRKMHPLFDSALRGILNADPLAVIAVSHKAEVLVERWMEALGFSDRNSLYSRFVFVPKLNHPDYLKFLSFNTVFLNTFPFGAGVTTSESLSMCVPVLVLPDLVSTAQLALAQIRSLGRGLGSKGGAGEGIESDESSESALEALLITHSLEQYVLHATLLAGLVDMDSSQLAAAAYIAAGGGEGSKSVAALFYSTLARMFDVVTPPPPVTYATTVRTVTSSSLPSHSAHHALRHHICSLKGHLFSDGVLEAVTTEWRDLMVRLAFSSV